MPEQRDICLIPVPFTDLTSYKKRPVLVLSKNSYNSQSEDILVMAITSNLTAKEYSVRINNYDIETGTLKIESLVRTDKVYSLNKNLVLKTFGKIRTEKFNEITDVFKELIKKD